MRTAYVTNEYRLKQDQSAYSHLVYAKHVFDQMYLLTILICPCVHSPILQS